MNTTLEQSELLAKLDPTHRARLLRLAGAQELNQGESLFTLGDRADRLYVVLEGRLDICFPFELGGAMKDIAVESVQPGGSLGWSAFVEPHRFTFSAVAAEPSSVAAFPRQDLERLIEEDPRLGLAFMRRIAELVGERLTKVRALWARELQRSLPRGAAPAVAGAQGRAGA